MKVGLVYPINLHCGISLYAEVLFNALREKIPVRQIDPRWLLTDKNKLTDLLTECTLLHIQYETGFFLKHHTDFYRLLVRSVKVPVIVSLHEVYDDDPAVYPRSKLQGTFPLVQLKRLLWDWRHPRQYVFNRHVKRNFDARKIVVHHHYHKEILVQKGADASLIAVIPHFIKQSSVARETDFTGSPEIRLGALGFINPSFDYDLLFAVLRRLKFPWSFIWIGGLREHTQEPLLSNIYRRIENEGWTERFRITGWIEEDTMDAALNEIDIVLALFKQRSSSGSIARCMGAGKPVVATTLLMTKEINEFGIVPENQVKNAGPLLLAEADTDDVASKIERLVSDVTLQNNIREALGRYVERYSVSAITDRIMQLYCETEKK